jgi:hypothetical protein
MTEKMSEDNKANIRKIKFVPKEGTSIETKTELEETRLRGSEYVTVTSYDPHLACDQEVEGDQHRPDTISNNVAFKEETGHVGDVESSALGVQLAHIPIAMHMHFTAFYFQINHFISLDICLFLKRINAANCMNMQTLHSACYLAKYVYTGHHNSHSR